MNYSKLFIATSICSIWNCVWQDSFLLSYRKANLNSQYSLSGAMVSPFRYDKGVTIYITGERIAPGLLMIEGQKVERSVATEDEKRFVAGKQMKFLA